MTSKIKERAKRSSYGAVIIGAGANCLSASITLAAAGMSCLVVEANSTIGGALEEISQSESQLVAGSNPEYPYELLAQTSLLSK